MRRFALLALLVLVALAAIACQGQQGPKGDRGATGPKGDTGATGPQGLKGDPGTIASLDGLSGIACTANGKRGKAKLSFNSDGIATISCDTAEAFPADSGADNSADGATPLASSDGFFVDVISPETDADYYRIACTASFPHFGCPVVITVVMGLHTATNPWPQLTITDNTSRTIADGHASGAVSYRGEMGQTDVWWIKVSSWNAEAKFQYTLTVQPE